MSARSTPTRRQRKRDAARQRDDALRELVLRRVTKLGLGDGDVLVLRLDDRYFDEPTLARAVQAFARQIGEMTRRPIVMLRPGQALEAAAPSDETAAP